MKQVLTDRYGSAYSFGVTFVLLKVTGAIASLRVELDDEETGLDLSQHGEVGYTM